jgi:hypothetical protein
MGVVMRLWSKYLGPLLVVVALLVSAPVARASTETDALYSAIGVVGSGAAALDVTGALSKPLPLSSKPAGQALGLNNLIGDVQSRWGTPTDLNSLAADLTTNGRTDLGAGFSGTIRATATTAPSGGSVDGLGISVTASEDVTIPLSFSDDSTAVSFDDPQGAAVDLTVSMDLPLRYDTGSGEVWLDATGGAPTVTIDATVTAADGATGHLGVLGIVMSAPASGPALSATAHLVGTLGEPVDGEVGLVGNAPGMLSASTVSAAYAPAAGSVTGSVTITGDTSGLAALAPLGSIGATLSVSDADIATDPPTVTVADGGSDMSLFANATASDIVDGLQQMAAFLDAAQKGPADLPLPFMDGNLSDAFHASAALREFMAAHVTSDGNTLGGTADFATIQDLLRELTGTTTDGVTVAVNGLSWNSATALLQFGLQIKGNQTNVLLEPASAGGPTVQVGAFDAGTLLSAGAGISHLASGTSSAMSNPSYELDLTPVLDLASDDTITDPNRMLLATNAGALLAADVPISTSVDATGNAGALNLHAGGSLTFTPPANGHTLTLSLKPPAPPSSPYTSLAALITDASASPGSILSWSHGGSLAAHLGIDVPSSPSFFSGGCANESASSCTDVNVTWPDVNDPSTLSVSGGALDQLKAFDLSAGNSTDLLGKLESQLNLVSQDLAALPSLAGVSASTALNSPIPLMGKTLGSLIDTTALDQALMSLSGQSFASLDDLSTALNGALGAGSGVTFSVTQDGSGGTELLANLDQQQQVDESVPLDLSLGDNGLTGVASGGQLQLSGSVATHMTVVVPVNLSAGTVTAGDVQVLPNSSVDIALRVDGTGELAASLGPLVVSAGQPGDQAVWHAAVDLALSDQGGSGGPVSFSDWAQGVTPTLNGNSQPVTCDSSETGYGLDVCADLPLYVSTDGGQTYQKLVSSGNDDVILRLPANDPTFDPTKGPIPGPTAGDPALPRLEVPDLSGALQNAVLSFSTLKAGFDAFMGIVGDGLRAASNHGKLPFVGSDLQEGANFIGGLQSDVDTAIDSLPASSGVSATDMGQAIQSALTTQLGSTLQGSVDVELSCGGAACQSTDPATSISKVTVSFDAGSSGADLSNCLDPAAGCESFSIPLDLGIPGVSLTSTGTLSGGIGWHLHVAVGLDNQNGFFVQPGNDLKVGVGVSAPAGLTAQLSVLQVTVNDLNNGTVPAFDGVFDVGLTNGQDEYLDQLINQGSSAVNATLTAQAKADWRVTGTVGSAMPGLSADFHLDWSWSSNSPQDTAPSTLSFDNVSIDPGQLLQHALGPIADQLNKVLSPVQTEIGYLTQPLPVLSDLSNLVGGGDVTAASLLGLSSDLSGDPNLTMASRIVNLLTIVNEISQAVGSDQPIPIGSFDLDPQAALEGASPDQIIQNPLPDPSESWSSVENDVLNAMFPGGSSALALLQNSDQGGFQFPILQNPSKLFGLLLGENVDLVTYDAGSIHEDLGQSADGLSFSLDEILPLQVGLKGDATIDAQFRAGYDTYGLSKLFQTRKIASLLDGFYIDTQNTQGQETPNLDVEGTIAPYAEASIGIASASVEGGLQFGTTLGVRDDGTGKFRPALALGENFGCAFALTFSGNAFLNVSATLGIPPIAHTWSFNLADTPLWDISTACPPPSGGGYGGGYEQPPPPIGTYKLLGPDVGEAFINDNGDLLMGHDKGSGQPYDEIVVNGRHTTFTASGAPLAFNNAGQALIGSVSDAPNVTLREPDGTLVNVPYPTGNYDGEEGAPVLSNPAPNSCTGLVYVNTESNTPYVFDGTTETALPPLPPNYADYVMGATSSGIAVAEDSDAYFTGSGNAYELVDGAWKNLNDVLGNGGQVRAVLGINDSGTMLVNTVDSSGNAQFGLLSQDGTFTPLPFDGSWEPTDGAALSNSGDAYIGSVDAPIIAYHNGQASNLTEGVQAAPPANPFGGAISSSVGAPFVNALQQINAHGQMIGGVFDPSTFANEAALLSIPSWAGSSPTRPAACTKPGAPTHLSAVPGAVQGQVDLSWQPPAGATGIDAYHVYRYSDPQHLVHLGDVSGSTYTFTDVNAPAGGTHYAVSADNPGGEGDLALTGVASRSANATITPTSGGTLTLPDGLGSLTFPAGAVTSNTSVTYASPASTDHQTGDLSFLGQSFTLIAADSAGNPVHQFAGDYTMTLHYNPALLPPGTDETSVNLYYFKNGTWNPVLPCAGCSLDLTNHTVTVTLDHFTDFALLVAPQSPAGTGGPGGGNSGGSSGGNAGGGSTGSGGGGGGSNPLRALKPLGVGQFGFKQLARSRIMTVRLTNPNFAPTTVHAALLEVITVRGHKRRTVTLARATATLRGGARVILTLHLRRAAIAQLARATRQSITLALSETAPGYQRANTRVKVVLPRGARRRGLVRDGLVARYGISGLPNGILAGESLG